MQTVTFTEARNRLKSVLDGVTNDANIAIITRRDASDAVVMSLDYYNSLVEPCIFSGRPPTRRI